jgi:hypothetical protein
MGAEIVRKGARLLEKGYFYCVSMGSCKEVYLGVRFVIELTYTSDETVSTV